MYLLLDADFPEWYSLRLATKSLILKIHPEAHAEVVRPAKEKFPEQWQAGRIRPYQGRGWPEVRFPLLCSRSQGAPPITTVLGYILDLLEYWPKNRNVGSSRPQIFNIGALAYQPELQHYAASFGPEYSPAATRWLEQRWHQAKIEGKLLSDWVGDPVLPLTQVQEEMARVARLLGMGKQNCGALLQSGGRLQLVVNPVACACLSVDASYGRTLSPHNIYNPGYQLTLLAGVARIWQWIAQNIEPLP